MEKRLESYRAKQRRQALLNDLKERFWKMVSLFPGASRSDDHVILVEESMADDKTKGENAGNSAGDTDSLCSDNAVAIGDESTEAVASDITPNHIPADYLIYVQRIVYFLFWATCYAIAIELRFGMVYLLFSALFGIYLNTRVGPRQRNEISAYSVFNDNCEAIDGTLNAEQFEREIRYGSGSVR